MLDVVLPARPRGLKFPGDKWEPLRVHEWETRSELGFTVAQLAAEQGSIRWTESRDGG